MNNDDAKLILSGYRPRGQDAKDPFFQEALRQAERDPSLGGWLQREQAQDTGLAEQVARIPVPPSGRSQALAAMTASRGAINWWRPLALAASLAVAALAAWQMWSRAGEVRLPAEGPVNAALFLAEHHSTIGQMESDATGLRQWLKTRGGPVPGALPAGLAGLKVLGCETWRTNLGRVSLLCFLSDSHERVHLYVFENPGKWPELPGLGRPALDTSGRWSFATWQEGGQVYVLASGASGKEIEAWLRS